MLPRLLAGFGVRRGLLRRAGVVCVDVVPLWPIRLRMRSGEERVAVAV